MSYQRFRPFSNGETAEQALDKAVALYWRNRPNGHHECRRMPTRHCPVTYGGPCGSRPCARFESHDETPWLAEL